MSQRPERDYRILDKDLGRMSNAEHAALALARPRVRFGLALVFIAAAAETAATVLAGQPALGIVAASVAIAIYLALSIGANDVANALSPAVGAGAIGLSAGLWLVAMMDVAGAVIAGGPVTQTLAAGLVGNNLGQGSPTALMMLAALASGATWISVATWLDAPISTTHSVVGAIAGAGMATYGFASVNWPALGVVALGWLVSPIVSGGLAAALLASLHRHVLDKDDPLPSGRIWLTVMVACAAGILIGVAALFYGGLGWPVVLGLAGAGWLLGAVYAHRTLGLQIRQGEKDSKALKALLGLPLIVAALVMGFAHGANDTSTIAAPLSIVLSHVGQSDKPLLSQHAVMALSGLGIGVGILLFGGRLVHMVGSNITRLNPARSLCVTLSAGLTVLGFSLAGLPVSTTHIAVGGVFGVGFWREQRDRAQSRRRAPMPEEERGRRHLVRRSYVRGILGAWLITVPANAAMAALLVLVLK
ncbi:inorganic phosphate transporter [Paracoccus limosus]|uniref:Phosphate transporter n=1 Tax=Paracoccus limosus TaxID=913252 RepID=A0A844H0B2_9RHOB|nr:inorganic phosphate transporter [Paracoccus limosus]MTH33455.1 inorganic phosphate transporter [Paracoccus limosus]